MKRVLGFALVLVLAFALMAGAAYAAGKPGSWPKGSAINATQNIDGSVTFTWPAAVKASGYGIWVYWPVPNNGGQYQRYWDSQLWGDVRSVTVPAYCFGWNFGHNDQTNNTFAVNVWSYVATRKGHKQGSSLTSTFLYQY